MPSVNDGPSELPDSGLAEPRFRLVHRPPGLLFGGLAFCSFSASRSASTFSAAWRFAPAAASIFAILAASRFASLAASRARPCGRLHAPPSPPPRVARVRQPRSSLSQRLRALPASPPGRAPPSRQLYASLARWLRASPSLPPRASPAARLRAGLSPRRHALLARLRLRDPWPLAWPFQQARRALRPCCLPP